MKANRSRFGLDENRYTFKASVSIKGTKYLKSSFKLPKDGSFGVTEHPVKSKSPLLEIKWISCREAFANKFNPDTEGFFFSCNVEKRRWPTGVPKDYPVNVCEFMRKTESIISEFSGVSEKTCYSEFYKTNLKSVIWISPSSFWKCCPMKRSLLSIMMRSSMAYSPFMDNYEDALFSYGYSKRTKNAMMRFLFGFTNFKKDQSMAVTGRYGWLTFFENKSDKEVKKYLQSDKKDFFFLAKNALWT